MGIELNNNGPLSPVGAKLFGADADGNAGFFNVGMYREPIVPFRGIIFDSPAGLALIGTGADMALDGNIILEGRASLKITTGAGSNAEIEPAACGLVSHNGCFILRFYIEDYTKVSSISVYASPNTDYTGAITYIYSIAGYPALQKNGWHEWRFSDETPTASGERNGSTDLAGVPIQKMKIRITPVSGQVAIVRLDSLNTNPQQDKANILITSDDGYSTWYHDGVGYLDSIGLKSTAYIIAAAVGGAGCVTEANLAAMYAAGHDLGTHGATALNSLANPAARYADIVANRDYLETRGFTRASRHYAWPNGVFELTSSDRSLRDALISAGMLTARGTARLTSVGETSLFTTPRPFPIDFGGPQMAFNRYNIPIIGHLGTADVGTSQLAALMSRIDRAVAEKGTAVLLFHRIGSTVDSLHCPLADFTAIADAVKAHVVSGNARCITISELYNRMSGRVSEPYLG